MTAVSRHRLIRGWAAAGMLLLAGLAVGESRGLFVAAGGEGMRNEADVAELLSRAQAGGFDRLYAETRTVDGVHHHSKIEKRSPSISVSVGDPLGTLILDAIDQPTKIEVWPTFSIYPAFNAKFSTKPTEGSPLAQFPSVTGENFAGDVKTADSLMVVDPGNPTSDDYLLAVVLECARYYKPPGILLTDLEYPANDWGYNAGAIESFRAEVGGVGAPAIDDPVWTAWRRSQVTEYLRRLRPLLRQGDRPARLAVMVNVDGPAPKTWQDWLNSPAYAQHLQDWVRWMQEGLVDEVVLKDHRRPSEMADFEGWIEFALNHAKDATVVASVQGEANFPPDILDQIRMARRLGADTSLYHYGKPTRGDATTFFGSTIRSAFLSPKGPARAGTPFADMAFEPQSFRGLSQVPPAVARDGDPVATPTPRPTAAVVVATPAHTPLPRSSDNVKRQSEYQIVTLKNGQVMRARVISRDEALNQIVLQPADGSALRLSLDSIESIHSEK